jgi:hypothetical protein
MTQEPVALVGFYSMVVMDGGAEAVCNVGSVVDGAGQPGGLAEMGAVLNEKRTFTIPPAPGGG